MSSPAYYLSWRGRQSGPFSMEEINARLRSGEVSGTHLIHYEGAWIPLEEFLAANIPRSSVPPPVVKPTATPANTEMERRIAELESELHRRGSAPPAMPPQHAPAMQPSTPSASPPPGGRRMSALAVVAFVFSLTCGLFLFLWPVAATVWLLSVIFGHASLSDCQRDPGLDGRGLAIAALAISYLTLLLAGAWLLFLRSPPL